MRASKKLWNVLGTPQCGNIFTIFTFLATIAFGYLAVQKTDTQGKELSKILSAPAIVSFIILATITILNIVAFFKNKKNYSIIKSLSELQNKYILRPEFKTSKEHGEQSNEKLLTIGGEARILTNSLIYDMYFCNSIAKNISNGAKYIYVIPNNEIVMNELKSYIIKLHEELHNQFMVSLNNPGIEVTSENVISKLKSNLEFWFFDEKIICLYNFARFNQTAVRTDIHNFTQSWWYINPKDHEENSIMLSREIEDLDDQSKLNEVFNELKKKSEIENGRKIYEDRNTLTGHGR
jgi:hypothetical protein